MKLRGLIEMSCRKIKVEVDKIKPIDKQNSLSMVGQVIFFPKY